MKKLLSLQQHAFSDGILVFVAFLTPFVFGFTDNLIAAGFVWGNGILALLLNLFSDYQFGIKKVIPMKIHSIIEYLAFPGFIIFPVMFFNDVPGVPIVIPIIGVMNLLTNIFTDYSKPNQS